MSKLGLQTLTYFANRGISNSTAGHRNWLLCTQSPRIDRTQTRHLVLSQVRSFSSTVNHSSSSSPSSDPPLLFRHYNLQSPECNVTPLIASRVGTNLHLRPKHPLNTIKVIIEDYWKKRIKKLSIHDDMDPIVSTQNNFDSLLIPQDHVSRSKSDTYYLNHETVLRTHTSAHQTTLLQAGQDCFLVTGDVYR